MTREQARETIRAAARRGENIDVLFSAEDLAWAMLPAELDEARQQSRTAADENQRRRRQAEISRQLSLEADVVLAEWAEAERAERRQRALQEARRRLGVDDGDDG